MDRLVAQFILGQQHVGEETEMPALLQVCAVIVTIALVAIAIVTIRTMIRFEKAAEQLAETAVAIRDSFEQFQVITREAGELVNSLQDVVPYLTRTASRFEALGERAAGLSSSLLEQVETPLRTVTAVLRGLRTGTSQFLDRVGHRITQRTGGSAHA